MVREVNLNHITKIEGHADLSLKIDKNKVKKCELRAAEGARFFEALVLNKKVEDIQEIVSRICGICSCAHTVASIQALEEALNVKPTKHQLIMRELLMIGERIRSHITHLYFLSLPDYYNAASALNLKSEHQDKINRAISLISLGNRVVEVFGGREIHPFPTIKEKLPNEKSDLIMKQLEDSKPDLIKTIELFSSLKYPDIKREADYLCLTDNDYASIFGKIKSNSGLIDEKDYKKHIKENIKEYATSKFALKDNKPYAVGAIARINNNYDKLDSETKSLIKRLKIDIPFKNPYHNNIAQALELLHLTNRAILLIKQLKPENPKVKFKIKQGTGVSAVEAPRGTLFHEYKINSKGIITYCNIITPTVQNLNLIEQDITTLVNHCLKQKMGNDKIVDNVEKLIRAYDPCFSCSTHFLRVKWL
ncbi:MAG TPA: Ni/Fe hydrogenase subunit alpha [Candidatus Pacearchaeota archaeon]|nr:NAD-reducing hydrogenase HoxS subunit beta [archaeon BMS3Abin17]HDK42309.1 Ni/Fe hydrogenase subunit alpha [Candidatus Pacearchaeota archaeon]HDZ61312.1 Ni/Fe hydrogenase subunit alpha [Candidatus Pacearchaeota archaeon]